MSISKINSFAKINLSLGVLGKLNSKYHKIESLISFINLHDEIFIKKINKKKHNINFYGKYSKKIPKENTVTKLLKILDDQRLIKNNKYLIKIKKNIPHRSGLGGGSMNASSIFKYLLKKNKIKLDTNHIIKITRKIGSDVALGMQEKKLILFRNEEIFRLGKKIPLHTVVIKPNFGCSTKSIYNSVKTYSKPKLKKNNKNIYNISFLKKLTNDLEKVAFKKYPKLLSLKKNMLNLPNVLLVRMTGSGSCLIAYFNSKKTSLNAAKILKKKYKNYWCILSKTI